MGRSGGSGNMRLRRSGVRNAISEINSLAERQVREDGEESEYTDGMKDAADYLVEHVLGLTFEEFHKTQHMAQKMRSDDESEFGA